jgi:hypothetical protein
VPTLIVHGRDDRNVPFEAATEHHRLVPQSELRAVAGNHFLPLTRPSGMAEIVGEFIGRVERGEARSRADALPERVRAAGRPFDPAARPPLKGVASLVMSALVLTACALVAVIGLLFRRASAANSRAS